MRQGREQSFDAAQLIVEWCRKTLLAWPANPLPVGRWLFFVASWLSNQFDIPAKRYAGTVDQAGVDFSSSGEIRASAPDSGPGKPSVGVRHRTP